MGNVETVQAIYEAFGQGDIPSILDKLADDVTWDQHQPDRGTPWLTPRKGRDDVVGFFESLAGLEITRFEPQNLLEGGNQVAAVIHLEAQVKATGRTVVEEAEVHLWTFGPDGKVVDFKHVVDTHQHVEATAGLIHRGP